MGVGAGLYMHDVVVKRFTFAISFPDEFFSWSPYVIGQTIIFAKYNGLPYYIGRP